MDWPDGHTIVTGWRTRSGRATATTATAAPEATAGTTSSSPSPTNVAGNDNAETWVTRDEARAMNAFDGARTTLVVGSEGDDVMLPLGLDSHRYRCCGNGVVASVAEWIGARLMDAIVEATGA